MQAKAPATRQLPYIPLNGILASSKPQALVVTIIMKGVSFQKPFEFQLQINGESWTQGETLSGTLEVKNRGSEKLALDGRIALACGKLSKVRQKASDAFIILSELALDGSILLNPEEAHSIEWSFDTEPCCQITDSLKSLFLIYGIGELTEKLGQLQLLIHPVPIVEDFLKRFEIGFRFVRKGQKSSKGWVEIKLTPPDSKAFSSLELATVSFKMDGDALDVHYAFNMTRVEATPVHSEVKKFTKEVEQRIERDAYLLPSGRVNHDALENAIREALSHAEREVTF